MTVWPIAAKFGTVSNFAPIGQSAIEISRFFNFQYGSCPSSWIFKSFSELENARWRKGFPIANRKIAISRERFDRLPRNLALWVVTHFGFLQAVDLSFFSIWRPSTVSDLLCACLDHPRRKLVGFCRCAKFDWNRCRSVDYMPIMSVTVRPIAA